MMDCKTIMLVDLNEQYGNIQTEIDAAIKNVLQKQHFILGDELKNFEKEFAEFCCAKYAVGVNSGTDALVLSLKAAGIKEGDEVITVPNTAIPTVAAIRQTSAKPVFADIDETSYNIDIKSLKKKITDRTKAIIPVHLYGNACDIDELTRFADEQSITIIEDACQAHGTKYKNKFVGTFGDFGCFSFYPSKNLGGYGDGGLILCKKEEDYNKLQMLRNYGQSSRYLCDYEGQNSRLDEIQAAVLRVKLKHLSEWNNQRRKNAELYKKLIKNPNIILPQETKEIEHNYHLFVIRTKKRDLLKNYLEERGIKTEIHYPLPLYLQKSYEFLGVKEGECPVAERVMKEILSLPMYPELREEQIKYVAEHITAFQQV